MTDLDALRLFGQGGVTLVMLGLFVWIVRRVGERMVASIDRLNERTDETTKAISAVGIAIGREMGAMRQDIAVLSARLDLIHELTPVSIEVPQPAPTPVPGRRARTEPATVIRVRTDPPPSRSLLVDRIHDDDEPDDKPATEYSFRPRRPH